MDLTKITMDLAKIRSILTKITMDLAKIRSILVTLAFFDDLSSLL